MGTVLRGTLGFERRAKAARRATQTGDPPMLTLRNVAFAVLALIGASVPVAAYTGYYAPACAWSTVWSLSGVHYQYMCF
jgi:hypothetical protein